MKTLMNSVYLRRLFCIIIFFPSVFMWAIFYVFSLGLSTDWEWQEDWWDDYIHDPWD